MDRLYAYLCSGYGIPAWQLHLYSRYRADGRWTNRAWKGLTCGVCHKVYIFQFRLFLAICCGYAAVNYEHWPSIACKAQLCLFNVMSLLKKDSQVCRYVAIYSERSFFFLTVCSLDNIANAGLEIGRKLLLNIGYIWHCKVAVVAIGRQVSGVVLGFMTTRLKSTTRRTF